MANDRKPSETIPPAFFLKSFRINFDCFAHFIGAWNNAFIAGPLTPIEFGFIANPGDARCPSFSPFNWS